MRIEDSKTGEMEKTGDQFLDQFLDQWGPTHPMTAASPEVVPEGTEDQWMEALQMLWEIMGESWDTGGIYCNRSGFKMEIFLYTCTLSHSSTHKVMKIHSS